MLTTRANLRPTQMSRWRRQPASRSAHLIAPENTVRRAISMTNAINKEGAPLLRVDALPPTIGAMAHLTPPMLAAPITSISPIRVVCAVADAADSVQIRIAHQVEASRVTRVCPIHWMIRVRRVHSAPVGHFVISETETHTVEVGVVAPVGRASQGAARQGSQAQDAHDRAPITRNMGQMLACRAALGRVEIHVIAVCQALIHRAAALLADEWQAVWVA